MGLKDHVRKLYRDKGLDAVWAWAMDGKGSCEKGKRFRACADFAGDQKEKARGDDRKAWDRRQVEYRRRRDRFEKTCKEHKEQQHHDGPDGVKVTSVAGDPHWGGGGDVIAQFVEPFMNNRGLPTGSGKRTPAQNAAVGGSPTSDHLTTHTTTMARDFPTYSGEDDARALAQALGNGSWQANSYASFYRTIDGHNFRFQILWGAAIGHGDHVHVGCGS